MKSLYKRLFIAAAVLLSPLAAGAQLTLNTLQLQARADFQSDSYADSHENGFRGKYLNLYLEGGLGNNLTYSYRQRFTKPVISSSYWDATDWIWADWKFNDKWSVNAGKQIVQIGGFEYDRAPINLYQCSEFWNNIACYQLGVSTSFKPTESDMLTFQICQSPNRSAYKNMYSYNLMWRGTRGLWSSIYSLNLVEAVPGSFLTYIALGNQFAWGDFTFSLDLMSRISSEHAELIRDISIMAEAAYRPMDNVNVFLKCTYDGNDKNKLDFCVLPGTSIGRFGAGAEYYPIKDNSLLRLHAQLAYATGKNGNPAGVLRDKYFMFDCGMTLQLDFIKTFFKNGRKKE